MTNLEALTANISQVHGIVLDANAYSKACIDEGITESNQYLKANEQSIDMATVRLLDKIIESANMGEGGLSYQHSMNSQQHAKTVVDMYLAKWGYEPKYSFVAKVSSSKPW